MVPSANHSEPFVINIFAKIKENILSSTIVMCFQNFLQNNLEISYEQALTSTE